MQNPNWQPQCNTFGSNQSDLYSMLLANQVVLPNPNPADQPLLPMHNISQLALYIGVKMVDHNFRNFKWNLNFDTSFQNNKANRFLQEELRRLLSQSINRWPVGSKRVQFTYKCIGA